MQNSSVLGDMVNTTFVDIIVGNQPVEYFDTFVENWLNAGGQETLDALDECTRRNKPRQSIKDTEPQGGKAFAFACPGIS